MYYFFVVASIFIVLLGLWLAFFGAFILVKQRKARNWPSVSGELIESSIYEGTQVYSFAVLSKRYRPIVLYRYRVGGIEYFGKRYYLDRESEWSYEREIVDHALGKINLYPEVFYNPNEPSESFMTQGISPNRRQHMLTLIAAGSLLVVIGVLLLLIRI